MRLLIGTFALTAAALVTAANACQPLKDGHDHRHWSVQAFAGVVSAVKVYRNAAGQTCLRTEYDVRVPIYRSPAPTVTAEHCTDQGSVEELRRNLTQPYLADMGFVAGRFIVAATTLEGVMRDVPTYFVGSCWGPWRFMVGRRGVAEFKEQWEDAPRSLEGKD